MQKSVSHRVSEMQERLERRKTIDSLTKITLLRVSQVVIYNDKNVTKLSLIQWTSLGSKKVKENSLCLFRMSGLTAASLSTSLFFQIFLFPHYFQLSIHTRANTWENGPAHPQNRVISSHNYPRLCRFPIRVCTLTLDDSHNTVAQSPSLPSFM